MANCMRPSFACDEETTVPKLKEFRVHPLYAAIEPLPEPEPIRMSFGTRVHFVFVSLMRWCGIIR